MSMNRRVALVTGSGRKRVGWFVADALARTGFDLAVHYRTSRDEAGETVQHMRGQGAQAEAFGAELGKGDEAERLVERVVERFGKIDLAVNCAAIWESKRLEEVTAEDLRRHFDVNVLGTFLVGRAAGLRMVGQAEGGCIVNFGDWAEARPYRDYAAYFASKGGIPTLTRTLAVELGSRNPRVRVNAVMPGPAMLPEAMPQEERRAVVEATLLKREGRPENLAQAVLYLAENDFVTGTCLVVDGGRTIYAGGA